jgi:hypothetical protein
MFYLEWRIQAIEFRTAYGESREIYSAADEPEIPIAKEKGHALDSIIGGQVLTVVRLALLDVPR